MSLYESHVRPLLRRQLFHWLPGPSRAHRFVAVAGLPRSGTSWLGKALSLADNVFYYFEPDQCLAAEHRYRYVSPEAEHAELVNNIDAALKGQLYSEYITTEMGLSDIVAQSSAETVLLKWVWLSFSLDFIAAHYPDIKVVQIIRHPIPQFMSWQQRDWDPGYALKQVLAQPLLMEGLLQPHAAMMHDARSYWEKAVAFWVATLILQQHAHANHRDKGWVLQPHEWFCEMPEQRIGDLISQLGLQWNAQVAKFLAPDRPGKSGAGYGQPRDPRQEINKWKSNVSATEQSEVNALLERYDVPFYREGSVQ